MVTCESLSRRACVRRFTRTALYCAHVSASPCTSGGVDATLDDDSGFSTARGGGASAEDGDDVAEGAGASAGDATRDSRPEPSPASSVASWSSATFRKTSSSVEQLTPTVSTRSASRLFSNDDSIFANDPRSRARAARTSPRRSSATETARL